MELLKKSDFTSVDENKKHGDGGSDLGLKYHCSIYTLSALPTLYAYSRIEGCCSLCNT